MSSVHLDTLGMIQDFRLIAAIESVGIKKDRAISDPASFKIFKSTEVISQGLDLYPLVLNRHSYLA